MKKEALESTDYPKKKRKHYCGMSEKTTLFHYVMTVTTINYDFATLYFWGKASLIHEDLIDHL